MRLYTLNQFLAALAAPLVLIAGIKGLGQLFFPQEDTTIAAYFIDTAAASSLAPETRAVVGGGETAGAESLAIVARATNNPDPADADLIASADPAEGAKLATQCKACHTFAKGGPHRLGPNLWGVAGRMKASAEGFSYSPALSNLQGAWDDEELSRFLENPRAFAPGTRMTFAGIRDAEKRAAIIAYLRQQSDASTAPSK